MSLVFLGFKDCLDSLIISLLLKKSPESLKFVLIDAIGLYFDDFTNIEKQYLAKVPGSPDVVVTDRAAAVQTLKVLVSEVDKRLAILKEANVRSIKEYNDNLTDSNTDGPGDNYMPHIVVVINAFDVLLKTERKAAELLTRDIAAMGKRVGINVVITIEHPSPKYITGAIKANFPARIAFKVICAKDSYCILNTSDEAHNLASHSEILFTPNDGLDITRIECANVGKTEI